MLKFKWPVILFILFKTFISYAYQPSEGDVTAYFGPYLYKSNFDSTKTGAKSPNMGGFGLVVLGDVSAKGSLEIGMFYLNKIYLREDAGQYIAEKTGLMHITMGYRRWFTETFSGSISLSSGYSMGEVKILHSDFAPGSEIDTSARDKTEYGFDFSLLTELVKINTFAVFFDARYALSVTAKKNENADHFGFMLALKYLVQEKYPEQSISTKRYEDLFSYIQ
ncbi:hypothetical protein K2P97_07690 [bacterium]|nr:hypothetical protein [bacterium]